MIGKIANHTLVMEYAVEYPSFLPAFHFVFNTLDDSIAYYGTDGTVVEAY